MSSQNRPLLSIRLIGPADVVTASKQQLTAFVAANLGDRAVCRTSTHPASYANEIRVYVTVTTKEVPPR
jgi:hypothetical protein